LKVVQMWHQKQLQSLTLWPFLQARSRPALVQFESQYPG
jgi:hypothetical protein